MHNKQKANEQKTITPDTGANKSKSQLRKAIYKSSSKDRNQKYSIKRRKTIKQPNPHLENSLLSRVHYFYIVGSTFTMTNAALFEHYTIINILL